MRRKSFVALSVVTVLMTAASIAPMAMAAGNGTGNPVIDFLEKMVQPVLNSIQTDTTGISRNVTTMQLGNSAILDAIDEIKQSLTETPRAVTITGTVMPLENTETVVAINSNAGLPFGKISRYSITVNTASLSSAAPGSISVNIEGAVLGSDNVGRAIIISRTDPADRQNLAIVERPFAASDALIRIKRTGGDDLGARQIYFSAYIELVP